jgi:hypothetical protein
MKGAYVDDNDAALTEIRWIRNYLGELDPGRIEFMLPSFASHVPDHAADLARLRTYAESVTSMRLIMLLGLSFTKTWFFLEMFLEGLTTRNPFSLFFSTRAQIELLSVEFDTLTIVRQNAGTHEENFADRVVKVDEALITAVYGTRDKSVIELIQSQGSSRFRPILEHDVDVLNARSMMTRIEKFERSEGYKPLIDAYFRLCDYLHPNILQNMRLMQSSGRSVKLPSGGDENLTKISRDDPGIMETAIAMTLHPMTLAARGTMREFEKIEPPFGLKPPQSP